MPEWNQPKPYSKLEDVRYLIRLENEIIRLINCIIAARRSEGEKAPGEYRA